MDLQNDVNFINRIKIKLYRMQIDADFLKIFEFTNVLYDKVKSELTSYGNKKHIYIVCLLLVIKYCHDESLVMNRSFSNLFVIHIENINDLELKMLKIIDYKFNFI